MKYLYALIFTLLFNQNSFCQNRYPRLSLYGNVGLPVQTNFDFKPTHSAYGDIGLKIKLIGGLALQVEGNTMFFKQKINFDKLVANYFTQVIGLGAGLLYEKNIGRKWFVGIGGAYNFGMFTGRAYAPLQQVYFDLTGFNQIKTTGYVSNIKGNFQVRRMLNSYFSAQIGVSYHQSNTHLLDMFGIPGKSELDAFTVLYAGLTLNLDNVFGLNSNRKGSKRMICPKFY